MKAVIFDTVTKQHYTTSQHPLSAYMAHSDPSRNQNMSTDYHRNMEKLYDGPTDDRRFLVLEAHWTEEEQGLWSWVDLGRLNALYPEDLVDNWRGSDSRVYHRMQLAAELVEGAHYEFPGYIDVTRRGIHFAFGVVNNDFSCDWGFDPGGEFGGETRQGVRSVISPRVTPRTMARFMHEVMANVIDDVLLPTATVYEGSGVVNIEFPGFYDTFGFDAVGDGAHSIVIDDFEARQAFAMNLDKLILNPRVVDTYGDPRVVFDFPPGFMMAGVRQFLRSMDHQVRRGELQLRSILEDVRNPEVYLSGEPVRVHVV